LSFWFLLTFADEGLYTNLWKIALYYFVYQVVGIVDLDRIGKSVQVRRSRATVTGLADLCSLTIRNGEREDLISDRKYQKPGDLPDKCCSWSFA
jgi:hypothetical protein